jgi:hypothetical protein
LHYQNIGSAFNLTAVILSLYTLFLTTPFTNFLHYHCYASFSPVTPE